MLTALKKHWPEYLMEAAGLGIFMVSACVFVAILEYPASPIRQAIPDPVIRRVLIGIAMGLTAISIVYSPWGKQSGAHLNPSFTLTFFRLGKVEAKDALFYVVAQFVGGLAGVLLTTVVIGSPIRHPSVYYAVTVPGARGPAIAFAAEFAISFVLMTVVLMVSNHPRLARFTGLFAGTLVAAYISLEAPFSGMSMNPARTLASALPAQLWTGLWIYFTAPPLGMLLAAELYLRKKGITGINCAKLHHQNNKRCIFCEYQQQQKARRSPAAVLKATAQTLRRRGRSLNRKGREERKERPRRTKNCRFSKHRGLSWKRGLTYRNADGAYSLIKNSFPSRVRCLQARILLHFYFLRGSPS